MSRSVDYLSNAETVIFFTVEGLEEYGDNGNYDDFMMNLLCEIKARLKSYDDANTWEGREVHIILDNRLCNIGISEYCGCWSLSVAPKDDNYDNSYNLSRNHAGQIRKTLEKCLVNSGAKILNKLGTFSNGESVYEYKK